MIISHQNGALATLIHRYFCSNAEKYRCALSPLRRDTHTVRPAANFSRNHAGAAADDAATSTVHYDDTYAIPSVSREMSGIPSPTQDAQRRFLFAHSNNFKSTRVFGEYLADLALALNLSNELIAEATAAYDTQEQPNQRKSTGEEDGQPSKDQIICAYKLLLLVAGTHEWPRFRVVDERPPLNDNVSTSYCHSDTAHSRRA